MAQFLKSQTPAELWKAALKPKDPLNPADPAKPANPFDPKAALDPSSTTQPLKAATAPGVGLVVDTSA